MAYFDITRDVLDEICLEGLDGITVSSLFIRLQNRIKTLIIDEYLKDFVWKVVTQLSCVKMFALQTDRPDIPVSCLPSDFVQECEIYPIHVVQTEHDIGSCESYLTRMDITDRARSKSLNEAEQMWGQRLVIVANRQQREQALCGDLCSPNLSKTVSATTFPYLELIGKARERGIQTSGPGSLQTITKDSRTIFYHTLRLSNKGIIKKNISSNVTRFYLSRLTLRLPEDRRTELMSELKKHPNAIMSRDEIHKVFPNLTPNDLKRIVSHKKKANRVFKCLYVDEWVLNPNADRSRKKKKVACVQLIEAKTDDCGDDNQMLRQAADNEDDDAPSSDRSQRDFCLGMPLIAQCYRMLAAAGIDGLTANELSDKFDCTKKCIYRGLQRLVKSKKVILKRLQVGKMKIHRYRLSDKELRNPLVIALALKMNGPAPMSTPEEERTVFVESGTSGTSVKPMGPPVVAEIVNELRDTIPANIIANESERRLWRIGLFLRYVKAHRALLALDLYKYMMDEEAKHGFKEKMDRKSLSRLADRLIQEGIIKSFKIGNKLYYAEPTMDPDSVKTKPLTVDLDQLHPSADSLYASYVLHMLLATETEMDSILVESSKIKTPLVPATTKLYLTPKFLRLSVLHDYIFYAARAYTGDITESQSEMLARLEVTAIVSPDVKAYLPRLYWDRISCYMFVPPLYQSVYETIPGWCTFSNLVVNLPLSVFMKLVRIKEVSSDLQAYLDHPLKCHYPIKLLPPEARVGLLSSNSLSKIMQDFRRLCFMGLIRFGSRGTVRRRHTWTIYVNTRVSIIDTTPSAPGKATVEKGKSYNTINYILHSTADIKAYWVNLFNICLETRLGHVRIDKKKNNQREFQLESLLPILNPIPIEDAAKLDDGSIPGDHLGAGGIDSGLFSFLRFNWISGRGKKKKELKEMETLKKKLELRIKRKRIVKLRKRRPAAKKVVPPKKELDPLSHDSVKKIMRLRISNWTPLEDNILVLCKAALNMLCSTKTKHRSPLDRSDIRTALRRHSGRVSMDKTLFAVGKRVSLLAKWRRWPCLPAIMLHLRRAPALQHFVSTCPRAPSADADHKAYVSQMQTHYHQMVDFMIREYLADGLIIPIQDLIIPDSYEELNQHYFLNEEPDPPLNLHTMQDDSIRAVLLSSLASAADRTSQAAQLFEVYRQYDENVLRTSLNRLHKQKVVTLRKRSDEKRLGARSGNSGAYRFSQRFGYLMNSKFQQSVYHDAFLELNKLLCSPTDSLVDVNLASSGPAMFALSSSSHVTLTVSVPEHFVKLDTNLVPRKTAEKIMARYDELLKDPANLDSGSKRCLTWEDDEDDLEDSDEPPAKRALLDSESLLDDIKELQVMDIREDISAPPAIDNDKILLTDAESSRRSVEFGSARVALLLLREITNSFVEHLSLHKRRRPLDVFVVTASKVLCSSSPALARDYGVTDNKDTKNILLNIAAKHNYSPLKPSQDEEMFDKLCKSCSAEERIVLRKLVDVIGGAESAGVPLTVVRGVGDGAASAMRKLEAAGMVMRLGTAHTRLVLRQHAADWTVRSFKMTRLAREKMRAPELSMADMARSNVLVRTLADTRANPGDTQRAAGGAGVTPVQVVMRPWLRVDGTVNRRVLDRMLGTTLGHVMTFPGASAAHIADKFSPALTPVWMRELINILQTIGCVTLMSVIHSQKATLFDSSSVQFSDTLHGLELDDEVLVAPNVDAMIRLGQFIGNKSYSKDILT